MIKFKKNKGFTLVELLVVVAIIGILSTLTVGAVNIARRNAKTTKALHDVDQIYKAINLLENDTLIWPGHQAINEIATSSQKICSDGCTIGLASSTAGITSTDGTYVAWAGPYMNVMPLDPWGNEYFFDTDYHLDNTTDEPCDGGFVPLNCYKAVVVGSYGPDGIGNTLYNGDDIIKIITK